MLKNKKLSITGLEIDEFTVKLNEILKKENVVLAQVFKNTYGRYDAMVYYKESIKEHDERYRK